MITALIVQDLEESSVILNIFASVIQRSALGPASYVVNTGDLRPVTIGNDLHVTKKLIITPHCNYLEKFLHINNGIFCA